MKPAGTDASVGPQRLLRRWMLGISLLVAIVAMAMPSNTMSWLRHVCPLLSRIMSWLEHRGGFLDLDHVVFFAALAFVWGLLAPVARRWQAALCLPLLAAGTELMQYMVPGRHPRWSDFRDDVFGAAVGWVIALLLLWVVSRLTRWQTARSRPRG